MFVLLKNADLYSPVHLGCRDILICGEKIAAIEESITLASLPIECSVIDLKGATVAPGFIDQHVHLTGGGGEG